MKFDERIIKGKTGECGSVTVLSEVDSTNRYARDKCIQGIADRSIIIADKQTAGRGRQGKQFYSPDGGLYMTVVFDANNLKNDDIQLLTVYVSVAVCNAINHVCGVKTGIKWVNDILVQDKKVCGILCEAVVSPETSKVSHYIAGIGINVGEKEFPHELKKIAGCVECKNGDKNDLAINIVTELFRILDKKTKEQVISDYRSKMIVLGKQVGFKLNNKQYTGVVCDINKFGNLIVECENEYMTLSSGEISLGSGSFTK